MSPDPWTAFLEWLTTVLVPAWGELVGLMPYFIVLGVVGPILTLIALLWLWYLMHRSYGRVRRAEAQAAPAARGDDGEPEFAANVPFCVEHALIYPPTATRCEVDRADLTVICPVDGTSRSAEIQVCPGCGTRYVLGVNSSPVVVTPGGGPPKGGAAVA